MKTRVHDMKYLVLLLCITIVGMTHGYTLDELTKSAYRSSGVVKNADLLIAQNSAEYKRVRADLMPKGYLSGSFSHYGVTYDPLFADTMPDSFSKLYRDESREINRVPSSLDLILTDALDEYYRDRSWARKSNRFAFGLKIEQPLLNQGKTITGLKQVKTHGSMLVCVWQKYHMDVKSRVSRHFYTYLANREIVRIRKEMLSYSERSHYDAVVAFENGETVALDTLTTFLKVSDQEEMLFQAEKKLLSAKSSLQKIAGMDSLSEFSVEGVLEPVTYSLTIDSAASLLVDENKEITTLRGEQDLAEVTLEQAKFNYLPRIVAGVEFFRNADYNHSEKIAFLPERRLYIALDYPLFSAGSRYYQIREAEIEREIMDNRLDDKIRDKLVELNEVWDSKEKLYKRVLKTEVVVNSATEAHVLAAEQFNAGTLTVDQLNQFEMRIAEARIAYVRAVCDYNVAVVDLRLLTADYLYD